MSFIRHFFSGEIYVTDILSHRAKDKKANILRELNENVNGNELTQQKLL
jgi:hypothetical protein